MRRSLMQEKEWQHDYISKMMPMLNHQISEVTYLVPWAQMHTSSKPGMLKNFIFHIKSRFIKFFVRAGRGCDLEARWNPSMEVGNLN